MMKSMLCSLCFAIRQAEPRLSACFAAIAFVRLGKSVRAHASLFGFFPECAFVFDGAGDPIVR
jgi:hypothetical protein